MYVLLEAWEGVTQFMEMGGLVLWFIAGLVFALWTLIFERFWYFRTALKADLVRAIQEWEARSERKSRRAHHVREALVSEVTIKIDQFMPLIKTLVALAPLFGLLGTVTGMIKVFEIMAITGGGDAKSMSSGVSMATIPTMSGMVAAISGVFGLTYLERFAKREKAMLEDNLTMDH